jgi:Flp pilus assembly protein TadG
MRALMPRDRRPDRGQAMTEFALIAPLFFLLMFGVIQMGILFGGQIGLTNAARDVARYASTVPAFQSQGAIEAQALPLLSRSIPAYNAGAVVTVDYCWYPNPTTPETYSQKVIITITYGHTLFVPLVGGLIDGLDGAPPDNLYTTTAREEMKVETLPLKNPPSGTACSDPVIGIGDYP